MSDQWQVEPSGPGVLGRLLVPQSSTKPAVTAFLAGLAGAGAFVASLVLDWQKITVADPSSSPSSRNSSGSDVNVLTAGFGSIDVLGLVYILGALGLLTILGSVLVRPESALRMRLGAAGLGIGLLGVLTAATIRLQETIFNVQGVFGGLSGELQREMMDRSDVAYESGMFAAFAAIALLTAGVWLAGAPAARAAAQWAAFAAAYPGYAGHYGAYYQGGHQYPYPAAPNGYVAPAQTGNGFPAQTGNGVQGVQPAGPVPTAAPAADAAAPTSAPSYAPPPSTWQPTRAGSVDELSVSASEPIEPGKAPDVWRG